MEFTRDKFNGIIVEPASLPNDPQALRDAVDALVTLIENERLALAWVTLPISSAQSIPITIKSGICIFARAVFIQQNQKLIT
ncbi:Hydrolase, NUDIX family [Pseudomonas savastanoi pv. nerii]|uniref:Hydrolase, NUDIX family n=1 Tax=Pseudomonas savastanoi pv. nerii TaxID=360921 RepID=A0AB74BCC0_PSESS|nr:hypothetical protein [Pseudomonas savastanoi]RMT70001.1 Hydrolase, NUDIX family [Pseudomonas savastanoi pv. nerii]